MKKKISVLIVVLLAGAAAWWFLVREARKAWMFLRVAAVSLRQVYVRIYGAAKEMAKEEAATARGARDPKAPLSRREAIVYVQHLAIEHLEQELEGIARAGRAATEERDRLDAKTVCEEGANVVEALKRSNEVLMTQISKVKPATMDDLPAGVTRIR